MRTTLCFIGVLAVASACGHHDAREVDADRAGRLLIDRNWIDVMPQTKEDRLHVFRFVPKMGGGVYQDRRVFKGEFELFKFKVDKRELALTFPDTGERYRTAYKIEKVDGPEPFDLKLTLERSPRGPRVYYGIERETDATGAALDARLAGLE